MSEWDDEKGCGETREDKEGRDGRAVSKKERGEMKKAKTVQESRFQSPFFSPFFFSF